MLLKIKNLTYQLFLLIKRLRIKNKNITIISNNCISGFLYHDLHLKFLSPTINTLIIEEDFFCLMQNFENFIKYGFFKEIKKTNWNCPIGELTFEGKSISVYFMHEKDYSSAIQKWERRKKRINFESLFFVYVNFDKPTPNFQIIKKNYNILVLGEENKILNNIVYFNPFKKNAYDFNKLFSLIPGVFSKRFFWNFDFVKWFNKN